jgi:tetratricopeptide (TPR) repeat protein
MTTHNEGPHTRSSFWLAFALAPVTIIAAYLAWFQLSPDGRREAKETLVGLVFFWKAPEDFFKRAADHEAKAEWSAAIDDYGLALKADAKSVPALVGRGIARWNVGKLDESIADLDAAVALKPNDAEAYLGRGLAYYSKKNFDAAIEDFTRSFELNPKNVCPLVNRGSAKADKGNLDAAIADYSDAIDRDPNFILAFSNRAKILARKGEFVAAIESVNGAIRLKPDNAEALATRADLLLVQGNASQALIDLDKAISLNDKDPSSYSLRGDAHVQLGYNDRAQSDYENAIRLSSKYVYALIGLGRLAVEKNEHRKALRLLDDAVKFEPELADAYAARGFAYESVGNNGDAIADYRRSLARSNQPDLLQHLNQLLSASFDQNKVRGMPAKTPTKGSRGTTRSKQLELNW